MIPKIRLDIDVSMIPDAFALYNLATRVFTLSFYFPDVVDPYIFGPFMIDAHEDPYYYNAYGDPHFGSR